MSSAALISALLLALNGVNVQPVQQSTYTYTQETYSITQSNAYGQQTSWQYSKESISVIEAAAANAVLQEPLILEFVIEGESEDDTEPFMPEINEDTQEEALPDTELK